MTEKTRDELMSEKAHLEAEIQQFAEDNNNLEHDNEALEDSVEAKNREAAARRALEEQVETLKLEKSDLEKTQQKLQAKKQALQEKLEEDSDDATEQESNEDASEDTSDAENDDATEVPLGRT